MSFNIFLPCIYILSSYIHSQHCLIYSSTVPSIEIKGCHDTHCEVANCSHCICIYDTSILASVTIVCEVGSANCAYTLHGQFMVPEFPLLFAKDDMITVNIFLLALILVWTNKDINIYNKQILSHVPRVTLHGSTRKQL